MTLPPRRDCRSRRGRYNLEGLCGAAVRAYAAYYALSDDKSQPAVLADA